MSLSSDMESVRSPIRRWAKSLHGTGDFDFEAAMYIMQAALEELTAQDLDVRECIAAFQAALMNQIENDHEAQTAVCRTIDRIPDDWRDTIAERMAGYTVFTEAEWRHCESPESTPDEIAGFLKRLDEVESSILEEIRNQTKT